MMKLGRAVRFNEDAHLEMSSSYSRSGQGSKIPRKCCLIADSKESSKKIQSHLNSQVSQSRGHFNGYFAKPRLESPVNGVFSVLGPLLKPV